MARERELTEASEAAQGLRFATEELARLEGVQTAVMAAASQAAAAAISANARINEQRQGRVVDGLAACAASRGPTCMHRGESSSAQLELAHKGDLAAAASDGSINAAQVLENERAISEASECELRLRADLMVSPPRSRAWVAA